MKATQLAARIYLSANAAVFLILVFTADPWEPAFIFSMTGTVVALFTSLPMVLLLSLVFSLLQQLRWSALLRWLVSAVFTGGAACIPALLISLVDHGRIETEILLLGIAGTMPAVLFNAASIHNFFISINHEDEKRTITDQDHILI